MRYDGIRVIGLTGGIACGKSSVAAFFIKKGVPVIDADQLARDAVAPGSTVLEEIARIFGASVLNDNGSLNRTAMREMVFTDQNKRRQLEGIIHPEIKRLSEWRIAQAIQAGNRVIVYMAPLLIETGAHDRVDEIWVVTLNPDVQLQRLMQRDAIGIEQARSIVASQMSLAEKEQYATVLIHNNGTLQETMREVEEIWNREFGNIHE